MSVLFTPSSQRSAPGQPANTTRWKARLNIRTFWVAWCRELNANWFIYFFSLQGSHVQEKKQLYRCFHGSEVIIGFTVSLSAQVSFAFLSPLDVSARDRHQPDVWQNALHLGNDGFKEKRKKVWLVGTNRVNVVPTQPSRSNWSLSSTALS